LLLPVTVALNCCVPLIAIDALDGTIVTEGNKTLMAVVAVRLVPHIASMVVDPAPAPTASPLLPIVATPVAEEVQVTELVMSSELPSLYHSVAANCCCPLM
jgi:hypothetical protein